MTNYIFDIPKMHISFSDKTNDVHELWLCNFLNSCIFKASELIILCQMSQNSIQDHGAGDGSLSKEDVKALCQGLRSMLANLSARDEYWERINGEEADLQDNPPSLLDEMVSIQSTPWGVEPRISLEDWTDGMARVWANVGRYLRLAMNKTSTRLP